MCVGGQKCCQTGVPDWSAVNISSVELCDDYLSATTTNPTSAATSRPGKLDPISTTFRNHQQSTDWPRQRRKRRGQPPTSTAIGGRPVVPLQSSSPAPRDKAKPPTGRSTRFGCPRGEGAMRRRKPPVEGFLLRCCGVFVLFLWTALVHQISQTCQAIQLEERMEIVRKVLKEVPLIDGHNDLPWNIRKFLKNQLREFRFGEDLRDITPWSTSAWSHTDLRRLKEGMVAAQFWSAYAPCSSQHLDAVQLTLEQIDLIRRLVNLYPQHMALVTTADGIEESHRSGKLASLIGIEGGHSIGTSLGVLRTFYQLGARYLTLTHTCNTPWADCCKVDEPGRVPHIGGLSHFGTLVVTEMNRLGMIVDLSHVSVPTMLDALATSKAPVIFSHSSAHAICNSSRNVPDHVLKRLSANGGLVMVAFYPHFVSCGEKATLKDVVAHINHIRDVAGVDHVGIGAGYDGVNLVPQGLEDVSRYPYLFAELLVSEKWTEEDIAKLAGRNLIRVFKQVEQVRDQLEAQGMLPIDQSIPPEDILGRSYCRYSGPRT